jgi:hypothetical protein
MIATMMILAGMLMMVWPCRHQSALDETLAGHALREAFGQPTREAIPDDMAEIQERAAVALRIVRTN